MTRPSVDDVADDGWFFDDEDTEQGVPAEVEGGPDDLPAEACLVEGAEVVPLVFRRAPPSPRPSAPPMPDVLPAISVLQEIDGYIAGGVVDADSGNALAHHTTTLDFAIEAACAANTDVVQAKQRAMKALGLEGAIEDVLISLEGQYHLIRPLVEVPGVFLYLAVDRRRSNLALARRGLCEAERAVARAAKVDA